MVRLIGKNKSVLKTAGSVSAGNKSVNDLLALFQSLATSGSITGVWNMNELYNSVVNSDWINDQTATTARAQSGGSMTLNSVSLGSYDYTYVGGNETVSSFSNSNYFTSTADSRSALVYIDGDFTINSGQTFIPSNRKLFTAIYVKGNLAVEGSISMSARGSNHGGVPVSSGNIKLIADGTYSSVPNPKIPSGGGSAGAASAEAQSNDDKVGGNGGAGSAGGTGGGGGGGAGVGGNDPGGYPGRAKGGTGAAGTSFSGGPGGGGATDLTSGSLAPNRIGANATANGGAGGASSPTPSHYHSHGGSGNPGGQGHDSDGTAPAENGNDGTGGVLVIFVEGNYTGSGSVVAAGVGGNGEGGATGGGSVSIFVKGTDGGPTPTAAGGAALGSAIDSATGGTGGAGTARKLAYT